MSKHSRTRRLSFKLQQRNSRSRKRERVHTLGGDRTLAAGGAGRAC